MNIRTVLGGYLREQANEREFFRDKNISKRFKTRQSAMKFANRTWRLYGHDAEVFKVKDGKKFSYSTIDPRKLGMKRIR